jgi:hypothetical protein
MKNCVFWGVTPCGSCSVLRLLVTASVVPISHILLTLMKEALSSSETYVLTWTTRRNIPEDTNHSLLSSCIKRQLKMTINQAKGRIGDFMAGTKRRVVYWDIKTHFLTHVSATQPSRLMLCKIWGIHGGHYEGCRLLGYKNHGRTSQETPYVSATEPSRLMLCKIWGIHGGHYEECRLLGYKTAVLTSQETHYVSATESSQLMLCKIWSFHGGDYEECRLLGYKTPVLT